MIGEAELQARVGYRFPGGRTRIERYQDQLLRDVVGAPATDGDLAHPLAAFIAALAAYDSGLEKVFVLFGASSADGPMLGEWTLEVCEPLRVGREYSVAGRVVAAVRKHGTRTGVFDLVTVVIELAGDDGRSHAVVRPSYVFPRR